MVLYSEKKVMQASKQASIKQINFNIIIKYYLFHYSVYMPGKIQTNLY